jgi:hypothetical protein
VQVDSEPTVALPLDELERAVVPDLDGAGAVVARRDLALECRVVEGMVLDVDGERTLAGLQGDALRDGPGRERAFQLEPEVVVEPPSVVALDDEDRLLLAALALRRERLGRGAAVPLLFVFTQLLGHPGRPYPTLGFDRPEP